MTTDTASPAAAPGSSLPMQRDDALLELLQRASESPALADNVRRLLQLARNGMLEAGRHAEDGQRQWRTLFDAIPDSVTILTREGVVLDINRAGLQASGHPREAVVGHPIRVLNPELPEDHMAAVLARLGEGHPCIVEQLTNTRADGSRHPVEVHAAPFEYQGRKDVLIAVARDISERQEAQSNFHELFHGIDKGVLVQDAQGHVIMANPAARSILELPEADGNEGSLRLDDQWSLLDADGRGISGRQLPGMRSLADGRLVASEIIGIFHRDKRWLRWLSMTVVPVFAAGAAQPDRVITMFSDITALKRDSMLFSRSQQLARIGGWEWDVTHDVLYLTDEAARMLGLGHGSGCIETLLDAFAPIDRERLRTALDRCAREAIRVDMELKVQHTGQEHWVRLIGDCNGSQSAVQALSGTVQDITARKQAEHALHLQARTDPLTGMLNRQALLAELDQRMHPDSQREAGLLYIDLNRFKQVNDTLGHAVGDRLLIEASHRIMHAVGKEGVSGRLGGDEFLVLCYADDDPQRMQRLAQAITEAFRPHIEIAGNRLSIGASIGIASAPEGGRVPQDLLHSADAAMYESKRRRDGHWQVFTPELGQSEQQRIGLDTQLRDALERNEFRLVYQPQVDLRTGNTIAAEALLRWDNSPLGNPDPAVFISRLEDSGDITRIGEWVLRQACAQVAEWRDSGLGPLRIAVNVSFHQFLGNSLAERVRAILADYRLPGSALEMELTERVMIEDTPATSRAFAELRALGVRLVIDDFGEGYSALNYLRRLPIQSLKLGTMFMRGVPGNPPDVAICQAIAGLARGLGLDVVAEGVETEAQRAFLLDQGIHTGQGFLYSAGLKADAFARYVREHRR